MSHDLKRNLQEFSVRVWLAGYGLESHKNLKEICQSFNIGRTYIFRNVFEEHRHCSTVLAVVRTPASNADALGRIVLSSPAENCPRNVLRSPLATLMINVRWKTNTAHPFTAHKNEYREFTQVRNIKKHC